MIFSQGNSTNRFEFIIIHADSSVEPEVDKFEGYLGVRIRGSGRLVIGLLRSEKGEGGVRAISLVFWKPWRKSMSSVLNKMSLK